MNEMLDESARRLQEFANFPYRQPDAYDLIHHAWMQGAFGHSLHAKASVACPYSRREYRMAFYAGWDIANRIEHLTIGIRAAQALLDATVRFVKD